VDLEALVVCAERGLGARDGTTSVGLVTGRLSLPFRVPTSMPVVFEIASKTLGLSSGGNEFVAEGPCMGAVKCHLNHDITTTYHQQALG
jgi:hypothetical protein